MPRQAVLLTDGPGSVTKAQCIENSQRAPRPPPAASSPSGIGSGVSEHLVQRPRPAPSGGHQADFHPSQRTHSNPKVLRPIRSHVLRLPEKNVPASIGARSSPTSPPPPAAPQTLSTATGLTLYARNQPVARTARPPLIADSHQRRAAFFPVFRRSRTRHRQPRNPPSSWHAKAIQEIEEGTRDPARFPPNPTAKGKRHPGGGAFSKLRPCVYQNHLVRHKFRRRRRTRRQCSIRPPPKLPPPSPSPSPKAGTMPRNLTRSAGPLRHSHAGRLQRPDGPPHKWPTMLRAPQIRFQAGHRRIQQTFRSTLRRPHPGTIRAAGAAGCMHVDGLFGRRSR